MTRRAGTRREVETVVGVVPTMPARTGPAALSILPMLELTAVAESTPAREDLAFSVLIAMILIGVLAFRIREWFGSVDTGAIEQFRGQRRA